MSAHTSTDDDDPVCNVVVTTGRGAGRPDDGGTVCASAAAPNGDATNDPLSKENAATPVRRKLIVATRPEVGSIAARSDLAALSTRSRQP